MYTTCRLNCNLVGCIRRILPTEALTWISSFDADVYWHRKSYEICLVRFHNVI